MASTRPFKFSGLPKLTKRQVAVQESLAKYLSYRPFRRHFGKSVGTELETYLKAPCGFSSPDIKVISRNDIHHLIPKVACLMVIGAAPTENKIIVDFDLGLASFCIDRLLGGSGEVSRINRALTEIEEGVLSFLILRMLGFFHDGWQNGRELTLTLDRFASKSRDLLDFIDPHDCFVMLGFKMSVGKRVGYARVLLPQSLIDTSFSSPPAQGPTTPQELDYMRAMLNTIGVGQVLGRVEIATLDLSEEDVAGLENGDIVILDNHQVVKTTAGVEGEAFVRLGTGQNGGLRGRLFYEGEISKLEITAIVTNEQPPEAPMGDDESNGKSEQGLPDEAVAAPDIETEPADNLDETEGLLRDVAAPVVVELGRIKLNTNQVVRLRAGQILKLPRGPSDPVNLVVNGKLFARGELVEVDGELGVRLMQVVGST